MGLSKTEKFTEEQNRLAVISKALGHPARIAILELLVHKNACVCGDIVSELPLSQSTVSQHLRELRSVGIIKGDIDGPKVCYCINPEVWLEVETLLTGFLKSYDARSACC